MIIVDKITIAVSRMDAMVACYTQTFGAELRQKGPFYAGKLGVLELLFCPRELAGVNAEQNTIQLRFVVDDVERAIAAAIAAGGSKLGDVQTAGAKKLGAVRDPDGNSIELIQSDVG